MSKIGLFFGSTTGQTETVADEIKTAFGDVADRIEIINMLQASEEKFAQFDRLILGISTWNIGEMQADWENYWICSRLNHRLSL